MRKKPVHLECPLHSSVPDRLFEPGFPFLFRCSGAYLLIREPAMLPTGLPPLSHHPCSTLSSQGRCQAQRAQRHSACHLPTPSSSPGNWQERERLRPHAGRTESEPAFARDAQGGCVCGVKCERCGQRLGGSSKRRGLGSNTIPFSRGPCPSALLQEVPVFIPSCR